MSISSIEFRPNKRNDGVLGENREVYNGAK